MKRSSGTLALVLCAGALAASGISGCSQASSLFYVNRHMQAIQRDTIDAGGSLRSAVQNPQDAVNGTIRLAAVESLALETVTLDVPTGELPTPFHMPRTLQVPQGFRAELVAHDLGRLGDIVVREDGTVFFSRVDAGEIVAMSRSGERTVIASELRFPYGLELHKGSLVYADERRVYRFDFSSPTAVTGTATLLTDRLPAGGEHYLRTVRWRPDDKRFYVTIGAISNKTIPDNPETATILRMAEGGGRLDVAVRGVRNTMGLDVHPVTGELWGIDQGTDWLGLDVPPSEINILKVGKQYGWPFYYSKNFRDPEYMEADTVRYPRNPEPSLIDLDPHVVPMDLEFYTSDALGADWKNSMLITYHGSVYRTPPVGFKVVRVRAGDNGANPRQADAITGFMQADGEQWGRPVAIAIASDGRTFYITDDKAGAIYRIYRP